MKYYKSNIKHKIYKQFNVQDLYSAASTSQSLLFHVQVSTEVSDQNHNIRSVFQECSLVNVFIG